MWHSATRRAWPHAPPNPDEALSHPVQNLFCNDCIKDLFMKKFRSQQ